MKLSTRAALYSALVFPGAGYFVVKKPVYGSIAFLITFAGLAVVVTEAFHKAQIIAEKIVTGAIPADIGEMREQMLAIPGVFSPEVVSGVTVIIGLVWLVGVVHGYQLGARIAEKGQ